MAESDDRPIVVSGGDDMITITLPPSAKTNGGSHTVAALPANGPFKEIVVTDKIGKVLFRLSPIRDWTITIE
jgi:hypothetical protein